MDKVLGPASLFDIRKAGFFYASGYEHNPALYVESAGSSTVTAYRITELVATIINYNHR